jgi:Domain of unknown function (DUF3291)
MGRFHLAQLNIALPREPLDTPLLAEFVAALDPVNASADGAPGFVWRLQTEDGDATGVHAFGDDRLLVNMSVWESLAALREFVYSNGPHLAVMRRRREWFERLGELHLVLWWLPAGALPTVADAEERLTLLRAIGPSPEAFTFRRHFPPPSDPGRQQPLADDRELCPAA